MKGLMILIAVVMATLPLTAQAQDNTYAVVIHQLTTSMGDGCGNPEFYAAFNAPWFTGWRKSSQVSGSGAYLPRIRSHNGLSISHGAPDDWGIWGYVNVGEQDRIVIRIVEPDDALCGGGDDHVDIARGSARDLYLWVARTAENYWVYFEGDWRACPLVDNLMGGPYHICDITSRGTGEGSAKIVLSVQFPILP
jgi:hypothetical protein